MRSQLLNDSIEIEQEASDCPTEAGSSWGLQRWRKAGKKSSFVIPIIKKCQLLPKSLGKAEVKGVESMLGSRFVLGNKVQEEKEKRKIKEEKRDKNPQPIVLISGN